MKIALSVATDSDRGTAAVVGFTSLWLLLVIVLNAVTTQFPVKRTWFAATLMGVVSLCLLTVIMGAFSTFSATTVRVLGFGELGDVDIVITSEACPALPLSAASRLRCAGGSNGATGVLRNVTLRSRIGGQVVVEASKERRAGARSDRVILRKEDVVMWATRGEASKLCRDPSPSRGRPGCLLLRPTRRRVARSS
ncbi:hypothetical protein ACSFA0_25780 [Variovorax sp. LT1P1]|uniref:hypothetical protein n=1 Tax=Variovorax sp. LT1P1 TaxID=3443730 RepID=UPI003F44DBC6